MRLFLCWMTITLVSFCAAGGAVGEASVGDREIESFLTELFQARAAVLLHQDEKPLDPYYAYGEEASQGAKKRELHRGRYLQAWAEHRNLAFLRAENKIRINRIKKSDNGVSVSLIQSLKLTYSHRDKLHSVQEFGTGTRHFLFLQKQDGHWQVKREWYSDPFDENPDLIPVITSGTEAEPAFESWGFMPPYSITTGSRKMYNRKKALAYADKYDGAAWGAGNDQRYNEKYRDYTSLGGDCTNFASQVIGDAEEGGGLPMAGPWRYWYRAGASHTWVQTDRFKNFLLGSGYGKLVARGTYAAVMKPTDQFKKGAIRSLVPGDLIAYELDGDVDHFAVLVGFDEYGYPLVNCHTADRYHAPFDLGWDSTTTYLLIHIQN